VKSVCTLLPEGNELGSDLSETLAAMRLAGYRPTPSLLVRLADRRVMVLPAGVTREADRDQLGEIKNVYGAISAAFRVGHDGALEELRSTAVQGGDYQLTASARNLAIFTSSLGITTGELA